MSHEPINIHGVAVAIGDIGLLILGESGSGKSALAARLIADCPFGRVRIVADDRVIVGRAGARVLARPHPALAGRLEIRGLGIVDAPSLDAVVLRAAVRLGGEAPQRLPEEPFPPYRLLAVDLPCAPLPMGEEAHTRFLTIWPYMRMGIAFGTKLDGTP